MNKLEEYKEDLATKRGKSYYKLLNNMLIGESALASAFEKGFDAAIALDLPVKFMEWSADLISTRKDRHILHLLPEVSKQDRWYTEKELYQYWIENIYKPE
jgi:hypothetical protein